MPQMNGTGPEGKGPQTGRGLGRCRKSNSPGPEGRLGVGLGKRRKAGGGDGMGKRFRSGSEIK